MKWEIFHHSCNLNIKNIKEITETLNDVCMVCPCANVCNVYGTSASNLLWVRYLLLYKIYPVETVTTLHVPY